MQCQKCNYVRTEKDANPDWQCPSCHKAYAKIKNYKHPWNFYIPNSIPSGTRLFNIIASLILFIYGARGIYVNDLYIPGKRGPGMHLHDGAAFIMYAAFVCACIVMLSVVIDHYDKRDNEHKYQAIGRFFEYSGWGLFAIALITAVVRGA